MLPDLLIVNGLEIVNSARATAYGQRMDECGVVSAGCFDCPGLEEWLTAGRGYRGIREDPAPWWDPATPESERVLGVVGLDVQGIADGAYPGESGANRTPTGATRDVMFRILVETLDECALSWFAGWLREALRPSRCDQGGCAGASACMLACCPNFTPGASGEPPTPDVSPVRHMFGLVAVEGPEMVERSGVDLDRVYAIFEFTLRTANVDVYRPPPEDQVMTVNPGNGRVVTLDLEAVYQACVEPAPCTTDPACPQPEPVRFPDPPRDPCYPAEPFQAHRTVVAVPSSWISRGVPVVPVITVRPGGDERPIRKFLFRVYHNPFNVPCDRLGALNPCRACADALVTYVPGNGVLVIDGRQNTQMITCRDRDRGTSTAQPQIFGPLGGVFADPLLVCGAGMCLEIYTQAPTAQDATVKVELWQKAGAG